MPRIACVEWANRPLVQLAVEGRCFLSRGGGLGQP
jgi:hypothetical protein